jgi:hypothetical protein
LALDAAIGTADRIDEEGWTAGEQKNEDENCTSSFSSSTIPLTSGIEEAPQLLLSVLSFLPQSSFPAQDQILLLSLVEAPGCRESLPPL